jgi:alkyldihydroxyacetonephosphate synthase
MRRWNGWGDDEIIYPLPDNAISVLESWVGSAAPPKDISLQDALRHVPDSRLPHHQLVSKDPELRLRHARGQSFPDWVVMRSGRIPACPDGVSFPQSDSQVRDLIQFCVDIGACLIPYGGGTSVVGHVNPLPGNAPILTVDISRMNQMRNFSKTNHLATFDAGVCGPDLEAQLRARGFTLGHFPQSFEYSTLGGWVATRSSGQQSLGFGRFEDLFSGGTLESPNGSLVMPPFPASAAGPDLREIILGSEGRLGILTVVTVRVTPLPEREDFHAVFFPTWEDGLIAVRKIIQARLPLSMLRYSTSTETATTLALAGHERLIGTLERLLSIRGAGAQKCMLLIGLSGDDALVKLTRKETLNIAHEHDGVHVGRTFGSQWHKNRFRTPYLRNTLWDLGYGVDTLETAIQWGRVSSMVDSIEAALKDTMAEMGENVHVFTHLSHLYATGCSVYTTFLFRLVRDPDENIERWISLKKAASRAVVSQGGTISHQHGVGTDHKEYLDAEKGDLGIDAIQRLCESFDPQGIMNPGKLV